MSKMSWAPTEGRPPRRKLQLRIPPDPHFARTVRDAMIGFALLHDIPAAELESLLFAVGEALANAIEHASSSRDIEVYAEVDEDRFIATVIDYGRGFERIPRTLAPLPDPMEERGRGIPIMQRCTDFFDVRSMPGSGTAITLGRLLRERDAEHQRVS